jgi:tRNA-Thr(GGU) m(6)t(6)A37 methyltransferase TsaA
MDAIVSQHSMGQRIGLVTIGYVENDFHNCEPGSAAQEESSLVLDDSLIDGLSGLEPGDEILVLFFFHRSHRFDLLQHPMGDNSRPKRGVFALRSPHRPNPVGVTRVRILRIDGNVVRVRGLDALNGTPILDLKPVERNS